MRLDILESLKDKVKELELLTDKVKKLEQSKDEVTDAATKLLERVKKLDSTVKKLEPLIGELTKLKEKCNTIDIRVRQGAAAWNGPFMHSLAAQILLFVKGDQPEKDVAESRYFQHMLTSSRSGERYRILRNIYDATSNYDLGRELDQVISEMKYSLQVC
jgi:septal ring factor EnvC (AmiA/AmiB activator)